MTKTRPSIQKRVKQLEQQGFKTVVKGKTIKATRGSLTLSFTQLGNGFWRPEISGTGQCTRTPQESIDSLLLLFEQLKLK